MDQYSNQDNDKQVTTSTYTSWSDYASANKTTIILILIVAAIAIWYFYFRKNDIDLSSEIPAKNSMGKVNIVRMRGSGAY
jgi:hypothetical protein